MFAERQDGFSCRRALVSIIRSICWMEREFDRGSQLHQGFHATTLFAVGQRRTVRQDTIAPLTTILRLERNRTRWSDQGALAQIGGWLYDLAIKRGFAAFRPLLVLSVLWLLSVVAFRAAYDAKDFLPAKDNLVTEERLKSGDPGKTGIGPNNEQVIIAFSPWTYAFELVVPLIAIDGKQNWIFWDPPDMAAHSTLTLTQRVSDRFAHWLVVADPILGWIMTSFLVTGIAGLIRSPRG